MIGASMPDRSSAPAGPDLFPRPDPGRFRAVALVAGFDSRRTLDACLSNLVAQGLETWFLDNGSTDGSREVAAGYVGRGVLAIEDVPRDGVFDHEALLERKEEVARRIDADWFLHLDTDEILRPPAGFPTVLHALQAADAGGFDAVNYLEFIFPPTAQEPDHDHGRFVETMRWYYLFAPQALHRLSAWKRRTGEIGLARSGGHDVRIPGTRVFPGNLILRHYPLLSRAHAAEKYSSRKHPIVQLSRGWHGWRERLDPACVVLPPCSSLGFDDGTTPLDESHPVTHHLFVVDGAGSGAARDAGPSPTPAPRAILVLGMHGSGASALTGGLVGLGVALGGPLVPPAPDDGDRGSFELEGIRRIHDRLLSAFGATPLDFSPLPAGWERHPAAQEARAALSALLDGLFGSRALLAVKDSRLGLLLPIWLPLLAERGVDPAFVLIHRSPSEVARSLGRRGVPPEAALAAWLAHVESAERLTRGQVRSVVRYVDLLARPVAELERIGTALHLAWPFPPAGERARIEAFLASGRRPGRDVPPPPEAFRVAALVLESLAEAVDGAVRGGDEAEARSRIDGAAEACHLLLARLGWPEASPETPDDVRRLEWFPPQVPPVMRAGSRYEVGVAFRNLARRSLPNFALSVSYHWRDAADPENAELFNGLRTPVTRPVPPGTREALVVAVEAPARPGTYLLELDLVREHLTWFSWAGVPGPAVEVRVTAD